MRRWGPAAGSLIVVLAIGPLSLGTPTGRQALVAGVLAAEVAAPEYLRPFDFLLPGIEREEIRLEAEDHSFDAVVFRPRDGRQGGAVVFAMGAGAWPLDDPRLARVGRLLAGAGITVMAVDSPGLRFNEIRGRDVGGLAIGFDRVCRPPKVDTSRCGFLGISVGGGMALTAAADSRIADRVAFVDTVGTYFSPVEELRTVTVGDGRGWQARPEAARIVRKQAIDVALDGNDRAILDGIFYFGRADDRGDVDQLSEPGRKMLALLDASSPAAFDAAFAATGLADNPGLTAVSPEANAAGVRAPVHLLHSRADHYIPVQQSAEAYAAFKGMKGSFFEEFAAIDHADPSRSRLTPALVADSLRLYCYLLGLVGRAGR